MNENNDLEFYPIEAIHWAGMKDENLPDLKHILDKYPQYINAKNSQNDNLLLIATRVGNFNIVKYLIEETEININETILEGNALSVALQLNKKEIAHYLIDKNIDTYALDNLGQNSLFLASQIGDDELIEKLLNKGVNVNHIDSNGNNILFGFFSNYISHNNYLAFELIIHKLDKNIISQKNNMGIDIFKHIENLKKEAKEKNNIIRLKKLNEGLEPLIFLLNDTINH